MHGAVTSANRRKIEIDDMIRGWPLCHSGDSGLFDLHYKPPPMVPESTIKRAFFGSDTYTPPERGAFVHRCYPLIRSISIDSRFSLAPSRGGKQGSEQLRQAETERRMPHASEDKIRTNEPDSSVDKNVAEHGVSWWNLRAVLLAIHMGDDIGISRFSIPAKEGDSGENIYRVGVEHESGRRLELIELCPGDMMTIYQSLVPITTGNAGPCQCLPYKVEKLFDY